jgi:hypothetical protein
MMPVLLRVSAISDQQDGGGSYRNPGNNIQDVINALHGFSHPSGSYDDFF